MIRLKFIFLVIIYTELCLPRTFLISNSNSSLTEIAVSFFSNTPSILYSNETSFIDSLEVITEHDLVFWEKEIPFTALEKFFISNFNISGGSLSLFGKDIYDDSNFFIENFGGTFLRNNISEILFFESDTINLNPDSPTIEIQQIDLNSTVLLKYNDYEIASIQNSTSNFILNGFWMEDVSQNDLASYIMLIEQQLMQNKVELKIGSTNSDDASSITIPIELINQQNIGYIDFILNIENDYLYNFNLTSTERSIGMDWQVIDLPFGNIKIIANYNSSYIFEGDGPIATIEALPASNSVGKIALQILESHVLDSSENELSVIHENGEIDFTDDIPLLYFSDNNSVQLGESSSIDLNLKNDMPISGFQLCFEFDSENILFVQGVQSDRIPADWWVGQFGLGSNDEIQFASLGWSNLPAGDGPILNIEFISVGDLPSISPIGICDSYLLNSNSQSLESQFSDADITIYTPNIFITPKLIKSQNYMDVILSYYSENEFSGFQLDLINMGEAYLDIFGYFGSYITGNFIDGTTNRILGFTQNGSANYPENGILFVASFNYQNSLENYVEFDNLMFSDNQGEIEYSEIQPLIMNDFSFGDIDGNGEIDIIDILIINEYLASNIELGLAQKENSDLDFDGNLTIIDIVILLQEALR